MLVTILASVGVYAIAGTAFAIILNLSKIVDYYRSDRKSESDLEEILSTNYLVTLLWPLLVPGLILFTVYDRVNRKQIVKINRKYDTVEDMLNLLENLGIETALYDDVIKAFDKQKEKLLKSRSKW